MTTKDIHYAIGGNDGSSTIHVRETGGVTPKGYLPLDWQELASYTRHDPSSNTADGKAGERK